MQRGGRLAKRLSGRVDYLVVPHGAAAKLDALRDEILRRTGRGAGWVVSEDALLRWLGLLPRASGPRDIPEERLLSLSGLAPPVPRLLEVFDVITRDRDSFGFDDLRAARTVARILSEGVPLSLVLATVAVLRRRDRWTGAAEIAALEVVHGDLLVRAGGALIEPGGQMRLALGDARADADEMFEAAEAAAAAGNPDAAERLYRACLAAVPRDPVTHFNLGNLLRDLGRTAEARVHYLAAVAAEPGFAEAHYNLGHLAAGRGELEHAVEHHRAAVEADGEFADAVYSLAQALVRLGRFAEAIPLLERYVVKDRSSAWAREARTALMACRAATLRRPASESAARRL